MKYFLSILFLFFVSFGFSQFSLKIIESKSGKTVFGSLFEDSTRLAETTTEFLQSYHYKGFVEARFDSVYVVKGVETYWFHQGKQYVWKSITKSEKVKNILSSSSYSNVFSPLDIEKMAETVMSYYEDNGYPFSEVFLDSVIIDDSLVSAQLKVNKNQFIKIDSLIMKGGSKTSISVIAKSIGYSKGMAYSQSFVSGIFSKLQNLPYVSQIRAPEVYFTPGKSSVVVYLDDRANSRFDGLIGLNPDENTGELTIVGELNIDLLNALRRGERIKLNWERVKTNSQNFNFLVEYPFLFKSSFGIKTELNYFRQDTSFANLDALLGISYFIDDRQQFGVNTQVIQSNSLLVQAATVSLIPQINSVTTLYYGINYSFNSLDYRINPRKGWELHTNISVGNKRVLKNQTVTTEDYLEIEDRTRQFKSEASVRYFQPLFKKSTLLLQLQSAGLLGDNIFTNELYQIGGLKTLRGFNQQSIFASSYSIFTTEYRYLFDRNSSVFVFADAAFYENNSVNEYINDFPIGFGAGLNLQTGSGILTLTYGLGAQQNNPILIRNGKVHVGFISLF